MTEKKMGIKNTKEMLVFLFVLGKAVKEAKENDGEISYMDAMLLMKVLPVMGPAVEDAGKIIDEVKDLDKEEADELVSYIGKEVGEIISKEKLVDQVVAGLKVAQAINEFVKLL